MRRLKMISIVMSVFVLLGAASVWADDLYEQYRAKNVEVFVNNKKVKSDGLLVEMQGSGRTMLPVRDVANELGVFVDWDSKTQTANLHKPNIDLILATLEWDSSSNQYQYGLFQKVNYNKAAPAFVVIAQIDSMKEAVHSYRFTIKDPGGDIVYEHEMKNDRPHEEQIIWRTTPSIRLTFDEIGMYEVELGIKRKESDNYLTVAKKMFLSE